MTCVTNSSQPMCTSISKASSLTPSELHLLDLNRQKGPWGFLCIKGGFSSHLLMQAACIHVCTAHAERETHRTQKVDKFLFEMSFKIHKAEDQRDNQQPSFCMNNEAAASHEHPPRIHCTISAVLRKIRHDVSVQVAFPLDKRSDSLFYQNRALPTVWLDYKALEHLRSSAEGQEVSMWHRRIRVIWQSPPILPPHRESDRRTQAIRNGW